MLFRADLHLFVCGFKVNAGAYKSDAIGKLRRSGKWHLVLTWHTVLSKTRRGSLPSAKTTFSLPTAMPKGNFSRASAMLRLVSTIQLLAISLRSKPCTVSGSSSALFQLPSQMSRSGGSAESGFFAGH